jgi:hypothetical protein
VALVLAAGTARAAEPRDPAAAEALFEDARRLLEQGEYQAACPKFAESYRLDPATGVLFALALCHERSGKLALAWAEFIDVAGRANADHNTEREAAARERADALLPRLSFLVIQVDPATAGLPGLNLQHDGIALRPAAFGSALPVDPGRHLVRAEAPGHRPWEATLEVGSEPGRQVITVPALEPLPPPRPRPTPAPPARARAPERPGLLTLTPLRLGGIALGSAGVASLALGGAALVRALQEKSDADHECTARGCTLAGENGRSAAHEAATWATVGAVSGAALLGAGVVLYLVGQPPSPGRQVGYVRLLVGPAHVGVAGEL